MDSNWIPGVIHTSRVLSEGGLENSHQNLTGKRPEERERMLGKKVTGISLASKAIETFPQRPRKGRC